MQCGLVAAVLLAVVATAPALAQDIRSPAFASKSIGVRVQVSQPLILQNTNNLSFGQLAATNSGLRARVERTSPDAGRFELRGAGNEEISVTYVAPTQLTNEQGAGVIGVTLELFGAASQADASSATRMLQNETISLAGGRYFFFIGGELRVGAVSANPPGLYSGEFELEVSYLNL